MNMALSSRQHHVVKACLQSKPPLRVNVNKDETILVRALSHAAQNGARQRQVSTINEYLQSVHRDFFRK